MVNELSEEELDYIVKIKNQSKYKKINILLLLPIGAYYNEKKIKEYGIFEIVRKPIKIAELFKVLKKAYGYEIDIKRKIENEQKEEKGINILLAEDDPGNQKVLRRILEHEGYTVFCADNGNEAITVMSECKIDLILMDLRMPELDGIEATKIIRNSNNNMDPALPIIAISAKALQEDIENCLKIGFNDYIIKPINIKEFLKKVEQNLEYVNKIKKKKRKLRNKLEKLSIHLDDLKRSLAEEDYSYAEKYAKYIQSIAKSINNTIIKTGT